MQLDVAQQVPLLGEGSSTLVTLKRPLAYEHMDEQDVRGKSFEVLPLFIDI